MADWDFHMLIWGAHWWSATTVDEHDASVSEYPHLGQWDGTDRDRRSWIDQDGNHAPHWWMLHHLTIPMREAALNG